MGMTFTFVQWGPFHKWSADERLARVHQGVALHKTLPALVPPFSTSRSSPFFLRMMLLPMRKLEKTAKPRPM